MIHMSRLLPWIHDGTANLLGESGYAFMEAMKLRNIIGYGVCMFCLFSFFPLYQPYPAILLLWHHISKKE
jgi:hypothetical protein